MQANARRAARALMVACALGSGCAERDLSTLEARQARESEKRIPVVQNRNLDILFVLDSSGSMEEEQDSLARNFDKFIAVLETIEGGLPNVHIGVVSTDLGAGPYAIEGCREGGDGGALQRAPRVSGCSPPDDPYISDVADGSGGRVKNYAGTLQETFSCIARLGTSGCGFEQPLEAMRRALDGSNSANDRFLREDAYLAVIFITDEDDCSVFDPRMFDPAQSALDSELGPLSSYRCFEFGVECEPDSRTQAGPRGNCRPRDDSPFMYQVQEYVDFLKGLKGDPSLVLTAGILGDRAPVVVNQDEDGPALQPSCASASGEAFPAVRLGAFLDRFPLRNRRETICNEDLTGALEQIAEGWVHHFDPCLEGPIKLDDDGEPVCTVEEVEEPGTEGEVRTLLPRCSEAGGARPCWDAESSPACSTETNLALVVERSEPLVSRDVLVEARCELE